MSLLYFQILLRKQFCQKNLNKFLYYSFNAHCTSSSALSCVLCTVSDVVMRVVVVEVVVVVVVVGMLTKMENLSDV